MIFIVGPGRSGTHWLARSFADSGFRVVGESDPLFQLSIEAALRLGDRARILDEMVELYSAMDPATVDKCHPNLWCAAELAVRVPDARFVLMTRSILGLVRSMLAHPGCLRWVKEEKMYGVESDDRFVGRVPGVEAQTLAGACAVRAALHLKRVADLAWPGLPNFCVFDYDAAVRDPETTQSELQERLDAHNFRLEEPKVRGHRPLSGRELADVRRVLREIQLGDLPL